MAPLADSAQTSLIWMEGMNVAINHDQDELPRVLVSSPVKQKAKVADRWSFRVVSGECFVVMGSGHTYLHRDAASACILIHSNHCRIHRGIPGDGED